VTGMTWRWDRSSFRRTCGVATLLLSPPSEQSEWRRYCLRSMCVCVRLCAADLSITAPKRLKLRTSNLTCMLPGRVQTWPLKIFRKEASVKFGWRDMHPHERAF